MVSRSAEDKPVTREGRLLGAALPRDTARLFAAACAERVPPIFGSAYPTDDRPRKAVEAVCSGASVATTHVAAYAAHAPAYAVRASTDAGERSWQLRRLDQMVTGTARAVCDGSADTGPALRDDAGPCP